MYRIGYDRRASDDIARLDRSVLPAIERAIRERLSTNPTIFGKPLRHPLAGLWALRVGEYRVVYRLQKDVVQVIFVGLRSTAYAEVQKRLT